MSIRTVYTLAADLSDLEKFKKYVGGEGQEWRLEAVHNTETVCNEVSRLRFFVYSAMFETMMIHLPFSVFQKKILRYLRVAPSQLIPNAWGFHEDL